MNGIFDPFPLDSNCLSTSFPRLATWDNPKTKDRELLLSLNPPTGWLQYSPKRSSKQEGPSFKARGLPVLVSLRIQSQLMKYLARVKAVKQKAASSNPKSSVVSWIVNDRCLAVDSFHQLLCLSKVTQILPRINQFSGELPNCVWNKASIVLVCCQCSAEPGYFEEKHIHFSWHPLFPLSPSLSLQK